MKLAVILENIDAIVNKYEENHGKNPDPIQNIFTEYVIQKIKAILKQNMADNPSQALTNNIAEQLILFYREIFEVIRDTDLIAPHSHHSLLTTILLALAKQLATVSEFSKYQILIPTINITEYDASTTLLGDSDLELNQFVLNDDSTAIIEVFNCLTQASIQGDLKHTYFINWQTQFLSETEQERVINHSKESRAYWQAIQNRISITLHGESFGAVLFRLVTNLRNGGVTGKRLGGSGGTEENSGIDANVGIFNFFSWYNSLDCEDRAKLAEYEKIQEYINRLQPKEDANYDTAIYCVEIIADAIKAELDKHPELFNMYPKNVMPEHLSGKEEADLQVALTQTALESALRDANYHVTATYGRTAYFKFVSNVGNINDLFRFVSNQKCNSIFSPQIISSWIKRQHEHERLNFLAAVKTILDTITFQSWVAIVLLLNTIHDKTQRASASQIFAKHIARTTLTIEDLKNIENFFGDKYKNFVFKTIYMSNQDKFEKEPELLFYMQIQPYDHLTAMRRKSIIYLVTGKLQGSINIPQALCLTFQQAVEQTKMLNHDQLKALNRLYLHGLRGEHLRAYETFRNGAFRHMHANVLENLMLKNPLKLSPEDAINKINSIEYQEMAQIFMPKLPKSMLGY